MRFAVLVACCCALAGCNPLAFTAAGVAVDLALHGYELGGRLTAGTAQGIEIACRSLIAKEAALTAEGEIRKVEALEKWSGASAFCDPDNPPPADPVAAAFWLGSVIARLA